MVEVVGWIGAICFSICAIPQCIHVYKTKSTKDLSWGFLSLWFSGALFSLGYILLLNIEAGEYQIPIIANYSFGLCTLIYLIGAKIIYDKRT